MIAWTRPRFATADDWLECCRLNMREGRDRWPPETRAEIILACEVWPDWGRRFIPAEPWRSRLRLPDGLGEPMQPWDEREQERFLLTLRDDEEFRIALRHFLIGGGA